MLPVLYLLLSLCQLFHAKLHAVLLSLKVTNLLLLLVYHGNNLVYL